MSDLPIQDIYQQGTVAYQIGDYQQAHEHWQNGLALVKQDGKINSWAARFLTGLSRVAESAGNYKQALNLAEQALPIAKTLSNKALEADAHICIGQASSRMGDYSKAKFHSETAKHIAHQIGDLTLESDSVRILGAIQKGQGQFDLAKTSYQESLALALKAQNQLLQAKALNNLGELSQRFGRYKDAFDQYGQSLRLREKINDIRGQGSVLGNICRVLQNLNDYKLALEYCKRGLVIARDINDKAREANHLNNLASIYKHFGKLELARNYFLQSLTIEQEIKDRSGEAQTLSNIGVIFRLEGNHKKALDYFIKSSEIQKEIGDKSGQSATIFNIGTSYSNLGKNDNALSHLNQALLIQLELGEPELLWPIYAVISRVYHKTGKQWVATFFGKLAVNTIQSVRSNNINLENRQQKNYLEDKRVVYEELASLLIDQGRLLQAQQVLGMLKEEEYFDFIQRSSDADPRTTQATYTKKETEYETTFRELTANIIQQGQEYDGIAKKKDSGHALSKQEQERLDVLSAFLDQSRAAYNDFKSELEQETTNNKELEEFSVKDLNMDQTKDVLSQLGNTVIIYYLQMKDKLRIILADQNPSVPPARYEVPISRAELNHLIFDLRKKLSDQSRNDIPKEAKELYRHLIEPIKADLKSLKPKNLLIYPSRALRYLPFAILNDGKQYLAEQYSTTMYNAAAQTHMLVDKRKPTWNVAGFGVSKSPDPDFKDLPAVENEVNAIVKENLDDKQGVLPGEIYMNLAFTSDQLMSAMRKKGAYQVFHLATHFKLTSGSLEKSFLLAGNGEHINLKDMRDRDFQMAGKDLITLSACETALDESDEFENDGKEVEGLGTLIQEKGAYAVLATLWSVDDSSTAEFMKQFYNFIKIKKLSKAEAIRQTQLLFISGKLSGKAKDVRGVSSAKQQDNPNPNFSHPYFWAPFILMGNWQ